MNISKFLKFLPALLFAVLMAACGGNDPENNGDEGKEIPTDEITAADFVGAWINEEDPDVYIVLEADRSGSIIEFGTKDGKPIKVESEIAWRYRNQTLTVGSEDWTVVKISKRSMTLMDEDGYEESYRRIKKSEIPGYEGDDDDNGDDPDGPNDNPGDVNANIKTLEAEPSAYSAKLKGQYSGNVLPTTVGIDYSYYEDFPKKYTRRVSIDGKFGSFTLEATKIVDLATIYYRAVAIVNDKAIYGETKQCETLQGTYKIDGKEYKFIKVTGLATGSFSMMQTEVPPEAELEICGCKVTMNSNPKDPMTKGEMREFFNIDSPVLMRYPSPEEWMYAASGGSKSAGYTYSGSNTLNDVAWFASNSNGHARKIASKLPNELGFYDMSGNYAELTALYDEYLQEKWKEVVLLATYKIQDVSALMFNKMWEAGGGAFGGCWDSSQDDCQTNSAVNVTSQTERNRFDNTKYTVRLVYSRPD